MQEMQVQSLGQEAPLEKKMATHSRILDWKILWTEEAGGLQFMGSQRLGYNLATEHIYTHIKGQCLIAITTVITINVITAWSYCHYVH